MISPDEQERRALRRFASKMAAGLRMQAEAFESLIDELEVDHPSPWEPASELPLSDRAERQAMLLEAVRQRSLLLRSESIPRTEWLELAQHFGYDPRGTAGFFRRSSDGTRGLLSMDGDMVRLESAAFNRLAEYAEIIVQHKDDITSAAMMGG